MIISLFILSSDKNLSNRLGENRVFAIVEDTAHVLRVDGGGEVVVESTPTIAIARLEQAEEECLHLSGEKVIRENAQCLHNIHRAICGCRHGSRSDTRIN